MPLVIWKNSSIFVSSDHKTFLQKPFGLSMWTTAYFSWGWRCQFWSRSFFLDQYHLRRQYSLYCGQWQCCSRCFQFMAGLSLFLSSEGLLSDLHKGMILESAVRNAPLNVWSGLQKAPTLNFLKSYGLLLKSRSLNSCSSTWQQQINKY